MAFLDWTADLLTDDGALIQQVDVRAELSPVLENGHPTGDISIDGVSVHDTILGEPRWSPLSGPILQAILNALATHPTFEDHAWDALVQNHDVPTRPQPDARALHEESARYRAAVL